MPNSIEAVNNKAWILHSYLRRSSQALELVTDLQKRVSPKVLPGEFFDTLGAIQESVGQHVVAEQSYLDGLKKSPENPVAEFPPRETAGHRPQPGRQAKIAPGKALAARGLLTQSMAQEADRLVRTLGNGISAN